MEDLRYLVPFVEIVRCGNLARAAKKLGVTPSAISRSLIQLERRLGLRLINRTTRRLHLTTEGEQLFSRLEVLLTNIDDAVKDAQNRVEHAEGKLRISVGATFGRYTLMPVLIEFMRAHPQISLEINFEDNPSGLVERGFDLGVHNGYGTGTSYVSRVLCEYPILCVASPEYLARRGVPRVPADLANHECIGTAPVSSWVLEPIQRRAGSKVYTHTLQPRLSVSGQWDTNLSAALLGAGVAATSLPAALAFLKQQRLKIVLPGYHLKVTRGGIGKIYLLYPHREYVPAKQQALIQFLTSWFRTHQMAAADIREFSA